MSQPSERQPVTREIDAAVMDGPCQDMLKHIRRCPGVTARVVAVSAAKKIDFSVRRVVAEEIAVVRLKDLLEQGLIYQSRVAGRGLRLTGRGIAQLHTMAPQPEQVRIRQLRVPPPPLFAASMLVAACTTATLPGPRSQIALQSTGPQPAVKWVSEVQVMAGADGLFCDICFSPRVKSQKGSEQPKSARNLETSVESGARADTEVLTVGRNEERQSVKLYFAVGRANLDEQSRAQIRYIVFRAQRSETIIVRGTTDSTGSLALNERLALQRARKVKDAMTSLGLDPETIEAVGCVNCYDESNDTAAGRQKNRRVEIEWHRRDG